MWNYGRHKLLINHPLLARITPYYIVHHNRALPPTINYPNREIRIITRIIRCLPFSKSFFQTSHRDQTIGKQNTKVTMKYIEIHCQIISTVYISYDRLISSMIDAMAKSLFSTRRRRGVVDRKKGMNGWGEGGSIENRSWARFAWFRRRGNAREEVEISAWPVGAAAESIRQGRKVGTKGRLGGALAEDRESVFEGIRNR